MSLQTLLLLYSSYLGSCSKYFKVFFFCDLWNYSWNFSFDSNAVWKCVCDPWPFTGLLPTPCSSFSVSHRSLSSLWYLQTADIHPSYYWCSCLAPALFIRISLLPSFPVIFFCFLSTAYGSRWPLIPLHLFPQHINCSSFLYLSLVFDPGLVICVSSMILLIL